MNLAQFNELSVTMKYLYIIIVAFLLVILTPGYAVGSVFAQNVTETNDNEAVAQQNEEAPATEDAEIAQVDEDVEALENDLLLKIPEETDNPNYTLLFTDPSDKGVSLSIDGAEKIPIQSPYSLPALGIGKHALQFTYTNVEEAETTYETSITIIPRPPEIKPPEITNAMLTFSGTAIPAGTLKLFLTGAASTYRETIKVEDSGDWSIQLSGEFQEAVYTATAYVTKNGFGSDFSEPVTFNIGTSNNVVTQDETSGELNFSLSYLLVPDFYKAFLDSRDLLIYTVILIILGIILGVLIHRFLFVRGERSLENKFKSMLSNDDKDKGEDKKKKGKKNSKEDWVDTQPKEEDNLPVFKNEDEIAEVVDEALEESTVVEIDEGGETANVESEEDMTGEVAVEELVEEPAVEESTVEDAEYVEDPNEEVPEYVASTTVAAEEIVEDPAETIETTASEELMGEEVVNVDQVTETEEGSTEMPAGPEDQSEPAEDVIEPPSESLADNDGKSATKAKRLGIFSFLSRSGKKDNEKKDAKEEEKDDKNKTAENKDAKSDEVEESAEKKELSREEFLEQFKNYDPDPEVEERQGSMSEKLEGDEGEVASETSAVQNTVEVENTVEIPTVEDSQVEEVVEESDEIGGDELETSPANKSASKSSKKTSTKKTKAKKSTKPTKAKKKKAPRKKGAPRRNIKITLTSKD